MTTLRANAAGIYARESLAEITRSWRTPQFIIPTVALPPAFYALFAIAMGRGDVDAAAYSLATFGVFAAMGPALFGFGANVAVERETGQLELKRLSPMPGGAHVAAKLAACMLFAGLTQLVIYALGIGAGVRLEASQWAMLTAVHLGSVLPFALIGLGIGYRMKSKGAIALANVLFLAMAVMGGLWMPVSVLPAALQSAAWALPSYHLGELALMAAGQRPDAQVWLHAGPLALFTVAAALFAWTGQGKEAG
jgi:ABC-2 type transport system permease protein